MKKIIAGLVATIGLVVASGLSTACIILWLDEPQTPTDLIK